MIRELHAAYLHTQLPEAKALRDVLLRRMREDDPQEWVRLVRELAEETYQAHGCDDG